MKRWMQVAALGGLAVTTMGASCFEITDPLELTLDVDGVTSTYTVPAGISTFGSPQSCATVGPNQYADTEYDITNARVSDITLQTVGSFPGTVSDGAVTINGTTAITFAGEWNAYNTEQSLLSSTLLTPNAAGIEALVNAVKARETLTICTTGDLSQATTAGLQVKVGVDAQMDVTP